MSNIIEPKQLSETDEIDDNWEPLIQVSYSLDTLADALEKDENLSLIKRYDNILIKIESIKKSYSMIPLCYQQAQKIYQNSNRSFKVVPASFDPNSLPFAYSLLHLIASKKQNGVRDATIHEQLYEIQYFILFIRKGESSLPSDVEAAQSLLREYTDMLLHKMKIYDKKRRQGISSGYASGLQRNANSWLAAHFNVETSSLRIGIKKIKKNHRQVQSKVPLSDDEMTLHFNLYTLLFRQIASIIIDQKTIPQKITVWPEKLWIAPVGNRAWIMPIHKQGLGTLRGFNYDTGEFYTNKELVSQGYTSSQASSAVHYAKEAMVTSNHKQSKLRQTLASWACKAYFMQFLTLTGMNDSTAANLPFKASYSIVRGKNNHKVIKWRANEREYKFRLQAEFIPDFKRYLDLRKYLLTLYSLIEFPYLFIGSVKAGKVIPLNLTGSASSSIRFQAYDLFSDQLSRGTSGELRVSKGIWIRNSYGEGVSAYILQHSITESNHSYTGKDEETTANEMTDYFEYANRKLITTTSDPLSTSETPTGECSDINNPEQIGEAPVEVNCKPGEGCLFCDKYALHADEIDMRKLLSLSYIIKQLEINAVSKAHFNSVYGETMRRINIWLDLITEQNSELTAVRQRVTKEVDEHEQLTPYWYHKLEMLEKLGVL
ncbi:MAG: hypothetical protein QNK36_06210 [Colwellia sp.]|nr:hypothetical protein [Colwellia sp.]